AEANQHTYRVVLRPIVSDSVLLGSGNHCNSEHTVLHLIISQDVRLAHIIRDRDTRKSVTDLVVLHRVTAGLGEPNPNLAVLHGVVLNRPKVATAGNTTLDDDALAVVLHGVVIYGELRAVLHRDARLKPTDRAALHRHPVSVADDHPVAGARVIPAQGELRAVQGDITYLDC